MQENKENENTLNVVRHEAHIFSASPKKCNNLCVMLNRIEPWPINDAIAAVATLFTEHLTPLKEVYNNNLLCLSLINKARSKKNLPLIPKPLILHITFLSIQQEKVLIDIKNSIDSFSELNGQREKPTHAFFASYDKASIRKEFFAMFSPSFWERTPRESLQELAQIINAVHEKERERIEKLKITCKKLLRN